MTAESLARPAPFDAGRRAAPKDRLIEFGVCRPPDAELADDLLRRELLASWPLSPPSA
jgi:hypothetical protein